EFGATALFAGNKPGVTQTIPMAIYTAFNGAGVSRQAALALSVLLIATALAVLLLFPAARGGSAGITGLRDRARAARGSAADGVPGGPAEPAEPAVPAVPTGPAVPVEPAEPGMPAGAE